MPGAYVAIWRGIWSDKARLVFWELPEAFGAFLICAAKGVFAGWVTLQVRFKQYEFKRGISLS